MGDKGYISAKREETIAKILDQAIDFSDVFKDKKKVLGIISIGNFLEKNDRKIFKFIIQLLDDHLLGKNATPESVAAVDIAFEFLEKEDIQGFSDHIAGILEKKIDIPYTDYDKQIFLSSLMLFNGLIGKAISKINEIIEKADIEV